MKPGPKDLKRITDYLWEVPQSFNAAMQVPARFYASEKLLAKVFDDRSLAQLTNVATLPGVQKWALAMPDMHEGYGFPIGGVAAMDAETGVISPGGVGYDINCGVRLLVSALRSQEIVSCLEKLMEQILKDIPSGVGQGGGVRFSDSDYNQILEKGVAMAVEKGFGEKEDIENCEEHGGMLQARAEAVSVRAKKRGFDQLGTLGAGNHFLEVQTIEEVYDQTAAKIFGLEKGLVTLMIHCGSRGLGHQVATDYVFLMHRAMKKYGLAVVDRELACAPISSREGREYLAAMSAAANYAWVNRQIITHLLRQTWQKVLGKKSGELSLLYDVAHNVAKMEKHAEFKKPLCVHRKGATRAFAAGHPDLPQKYRPVGQPVLIPGTMGTNSYVLVGTARAMEDTFGSVCHGAGRVLSRGAAIRSFGSADLPAVLKQKGIVAKTYHRKGLAEEAPGAYKDIDEVVKVVVEAGLAKLVAKLKPLGVMKG